MNNCNLIAIFFFLHALSACKKHDAFSDTSSRTPVIHGQTIIEPPPRSSQASNNSALIDTLVPGGSFSSATFPSPHSSTDLSLNSEGQGDAVVAMPTFPPPDDDFGEVPPLQWAFAQCGNNFLTQQILEDGTILGEECEDGNAQNGDGCSSTCLKEFCGNGRVEGREQCDPGQAPTTPPAVPPLWNHAIPTEDCDEFCEYIICGDGIVNGLEQCDDCNRIDCDGCSSKCKVENLSEPPCNYSCASDNKFICPQFSRPTHSCVLTVTCPYESCGATDECCAANEICTEDACSCPNTVCNGLCCAPNHVCSIAGVCTCPNALCNGICCEADEACQTNICTACSNAICNNICCNTNEICSPLNGDCSCPNISCNGLCCDAGQLCINNSCSVCENNVCNNICCADNEICSSQNACSCPNESCAGVCCASGEICEDNSCTEPINIRK